MTRSILVADEEWNAGAGEESFRVVSRVDNYLYLEAEAREYRPDVIFASYRILRGHPWERAGLTERWVILSDEQIRPEEFASLAARHYMLCKPFSASAAARAVRMVYAEENERSQALREQAGMLLDRIGMEHHLDGCRYVRDLIVSQLEHPLPLSAAYAAVARAYGKKVPCIERSIRHAVEKTWMRGNYEAIDALFGYTVDARSGKPSNRAFVAMLCERLRMENSRG